MSATVLLIGILSIILLAWVNRIDERLRIDAALLGAIMDVQINTASAHLWLEQSVSGDTHVDTRKVIADIEQAIRLIRAILDGGKTEHDRLPGPLTDPSLRSTAEEIESLLIKFKAIALARLQNPGESGVGSISDRQIDLVFKELIRKARGMEAVFESGEAENREKNSRLFYAMLFTWTFIVATATGGIRVLERDRRRAHEAMLKQTGDEIQHLSSRLVNAQEVERKRISMELHDELGQALNVAKLRIRLIEKGLKEDQPETRKDCEELLSYLDQVIENVRRLSLDLSPTVLEDLGLTSALRWLVANFPKGKTVKVTSEITEIDHLLPKSHWITVYRVAQEALTNIARHAKAEQVSVAIRRDGNSIAFSIEDNGKGFNLMQRDNTDAAKSLGLTTMSERVRAVGGTLDIRSLETKGTRIAFNIPIEKGV